MTYDCTLVKLYIQYKSPPVLRGLANLARSAFLTAIDAAYPINRGHTTAIKITNRTIIAYAKTDPVDTIT